MSVDAFLGPVGASLASSVITGIISWSIGRESTRSALKLQQDRQRHEATQAEKGRKRDEFVNAYRGLSKIGEFRFRTMEALGIKFGGWDQTSAVEVDDDKLFEIERSIINYLSEVSLTLHVVSDRIEKVSELEGNIQAYFSYARLLKTASGPGNFRHIVSYVKSSEEKCEAQLRSFQEAVAAWISEITREEA